jgi:RHS repeat-associated protein
MDGEINGNGNAYDFGARMYDARLGRWWSVDPKHTQFSGLTVYAFVANRCLNAIDPNGEIIVILYTNSAGEEMEYVVGSTLEVPDNDFVKSTLAAFGAVMMHENSSKVITDLAHCVDWTLNIKQGNTDYFSSKGGSVMGIEMMSDNGTVFWDPNLGLTSDYSENKLAPFTALFHEIGHAKRYVDVYRATEKLIEEGKRDESNKIRSEYQLKKNTKDPIWGNIEEKENIAEYEIPLSQFFSGLVRTTYSKGVYTSTEFTSATDLGNGNNASNMTGYLDVLKVLSTLKK